MTISDKVFLNCVRDGCPTGEIALELARVPGDDLLYTVFSLATVCSAGHDVSPDEYHELSLEANYLAAQWSELEQQERDA